MPRPCYIGSQHSPTKTVTFSFLVPVCVDETNVANPQGATDDDGRGAP